MRHGEVAAEKSHESQGRGIYGVATAATPGVWQWQFRIGDQVKAGGTETRINLLSIRLRSAADRPRAEKGRARDDSVVLRIAAGRN